ncbi:MAG: hypothetical protein ACR2M4_10655 [Actinomycetota bacterium]
MSSKTERPSSEGEIAFSWARTRVEIGFGLELGFDGTREAFEPAEAVDLFLVADLCCIE